MKTKTLEQRMYVSVAADYLKKAEDALKTSAEPALAMKVAALRSQTEQVRA